jgi:hypothetical protein
MEDFLPKNEKGSKYDSEEFAFNREIKYPVWCIKDGDEISTFVV